MINLKTIDWQIYNWLKAEFAKDPTKWHSKKEMLEALPNLTKEGKATSHDVCSSLNLVRIKLNKACSEGQLSHLVLLRNHCFKLAADFDEASEYLSADYRIGVKRLVRYYENMKVLKRDGQGKLIDSKGNEITDESLAKRFYDVFNV